jgi:hypothetical protein
MNIKIKDSKAPGVEKKYIVCDGTDYRTISEIMTHAGDVQNHATSRNILLSALKKIAYQVLPIYNISTTPDNVEAMVKSQEFQDGVADLLFMAYNHGVSYGTA